MTREELMNEARLFYLASPVILPLIERRRKFAFDMLMQAHKAGRTDTTTIVAELAVLTDLEREVNTKQQSYETMEKQHVRNK